MARQVAGQDLRDDRVLGLEVVVQAPGEQAGRVRDLADRGHADALAGEQFRGAREDVGATVLGLLHAREAIKRLLGTLTGRGRPVYSNRTRSSSTWRADADRLHPRAGAAATGAARLLRTADDGRGARRAGRLGRGGDYGKGDAYRAVVRQLGADGWLALGWPQEYGGRGGTMLDQLIFTDEAAIARVPVPFLTINTVGPTIMRFGTPAQKSFYLPKIAAGEIHFSIGYSEPEAGTDLASLRTTATRDGDEYVIDGQKMWTSLIQYADYVWLACRTDPAAPRHKGLSIIIVPTSAPGFSWTPVRDDGGRRDQRHVLPRGARAAVRPRRRGEPGLAADHQPAQPRAGGAHLGGAGALRARFGAGVGAGREAGRRAAGDRRRVGPAQPGPGARQGGVPQAHELADRLVGRPTAAPPATRRSGPPRRRPRRCTAPSSPWRRTGC